MRQMQWFIRTTEELRERIEQIYRLESALARLDTLAANIDNMSEQLEQELRPAKVQHEMRLRALEPLLEQIEDQERFKEELLKWLDDSTAEIKRLRQEFSGLKKLSAAKTEKLVEQHATNSKMFRAELEAFKETLDASSGVQASKDIAALRVDFELLKEELAAPKDDPSAEKISVLQSDIDAIKSDMDALQSEIDSLKEELAAPKDDPSAEKIAALQSDFDRLKEKLSEPKDDHTLEEMQKIYSEFKSSLSAKDEEIKQLWQLFEERLKTKDEEIAQLKAQLDDRGSAIGELIRQVEHLWKKLDGLEEKFEAPPPKNKKKSGDRTSKVADDAEPRILQFEIESGGTVYINGTPEEIITKLKAAMNVEEMQTFLDGSKAANKIIFLRSLDRHVRNLQKLTYKLNFDEYGEAQLSEEITKKFFEIFKLTLLESVASASYRGLSRQPEFYREFLGHFNRYLQRCGIYTRRVLPNGRLTEQDKIDMKINRRDTINAANDDLIAEVERLPYYIDYLGADGSIKNLFFEGKLIAYGTKN